MATKPFPYQKEGVLQMERFRGRCLLSDEMGLGKTLQTLWWMKRNKPRLTVVVCAATLKWNWQSECAMHMNWASYVLEGRKPKNAELLSRQAILIINYDILGRWCRVLRKLKPDLVVLDECHAIKNPVTQRSRAVVELCRKVPHVIAISGTPLTNRPAELWPTLKLLLPNFPNFVRFARRYCKYRRTRWGWQYRGAQRLDELHRKLRKTVMIRRLKKDVLQDLPPKTISVVPMKVQLAEYGQALVDFRAWLRKNKKKRIRNQMAEKLVQIGYLKRLAADLKMHEVFKWIDEFLATSDEKLLVFGIHQDILRQLHKRYAKQSVLINGKVASRKRFLLLQKFTHDKNCRLMIGNIQAAGVGLNMTAACNVLFVEQPWTPAEMNQAIDRAHRVGQKKRTFVYVSVAKGTIEESLCNLLQQKQTTLTETLDGKKLEKEDLAIFDLLEKELSRDRR